MYFNFFIQSFLKVVPELRVDALIHESRELAVLRVLGLRSGQEIDPLEGQSGKLFSSNFSNNFS